MGVVQLGKWRGGKGGGRKNILLSLGNLQTDFPPCVCANEISISHPCLQVSEPIHGLGSDPQASVWREGCGGGNTWRECSILFNLALPMPNPSSVNVSLKGDNDLLPMALPFMKWDIRHTYKITLTVSLNLSRITGILRICVTVFTK